MLGQMLSGARSVQGELRMLERAASRLKVWAERTRQKSLGWDARRRRRRRLGAGHLGARTYAVR